MVRRVNGKKGGAGRRPRPAASNLSGRAKRGSPLGKPPADAAKRRRRRFISKTGWVRLQCSACNEMTAHCFYGVLGEITQEEVQDEPEAVASGTKPSPSSASSQTGWLF